MAKASSQGFFYKQSELGVHSPPNKSSDQENQLICQEATTATACGGPSLGLKPPAWLTSLGSEGFASLWVSLQQALAHCQVCRPMDGLSVFI